MKKLFAALLIAAIIVMLMAACTDEIPSGASSAEPANTPPAATNVEPAPAQPAEPALTTGQQQAMDKAQDYLDMGGFSQKSLLKQLEYEGFSKADSEFAIDKISPDWNAQAKNKAQSYMEMGGFSRKSLLTQLEYEGFTPAQAAYGAKAVGY